MQRRKNLLYFSLQKMSSYLCISVLCLNIWSFEAFATVTSFPASSTSSISSKVSPSTEKAKSTSTDIPSPSTSTATPSTNTIAEPDSNPFLTVGAQQAPFNKQVEVETLVRKAADYIKNKGKEAGFKEFNKKDGLFTRGSLYIFAIDYKGKILADGFNPEKIGKNVYDLADNTGKLINKDMIAKAKVGGGFELYQWINPQNNLMECKRAYVLPMEGGYFIASGYYFPPNTDGGCE